MQHVKNKGPLTPGHPSRGQAIVHHIRPCHGVFVHQRHKGIRLVARKPAGIHVGQFVATQNFHKNAAQGSGTSVDPVGGWFERFGLEFFFRQPRGSIDALGIRAGSNFVLKKG